MTAEVGGFVEPRSVAVQFRYAFVTDKEGLKVVDATNLAQPKLIPGAMVPLEDAHNRSTSPEPTPTSPEARRAWSLSTSKNRSTRKLIRS